MIHEIQRLNAMGLSKRMIAKALGCSRNTVDKYLADAETTVLESGKEYSAPWSEVVPWHDVESATSRGMPLSQCWELRAAIHESLESVPYVSFWREYRRRFPNIPIELHKIHPPGERCEIDYKGDANGLGYYDKQTHEYVSCRLFGAVLCFSQLFFAKATLTEKQGDLLGAVGNAYNYFGGVPLTTAPDYVNWNIIDVMCPDPLCGLKAFGVSFQPLETNQWAHNIYSELSQPRSDESFLQTA
ncbi:MAG: hypothetical protein NTX25_08770 [Proteobacteria bacterium]|nr:hypothetical protein [Pseudomonadota bacterium]